MLATAGVENNTLPPSQITGFPVLVITGIAGVGFKETALLFVVPQEFDVTSRNSRLVPAFVLSVNIFRLLVVKSP